mmetsp:Transcript_13596/g.54490  ORF Transcript_13596/g.54490 Transcript_13596/m.54490 type:complete len:90 (-) Transcript_13596:910-1179(-)
MPWGQQRNPIRCRSRRKRMPDKHVGEHIYEKNRSGEAAPGYKVYPFGTLSETCREKVMPVHSLAPSIFLSTLSRHFPRLGVGLLPAELI